MLLVFWKEDWNRNGAVMTSIQRQRTNSILNLSLQHCPKGERGFISPENIWEDPRVEVVGRVL